MSKHAYPTDNGDHNRAHLMLYTPKIQRHRTGRRVCRASRQVVRWINRPGDVASSPSSSRTNCRSEQMSVLPGSIGNPSVHSLLVTLGNHAVHDFQTYN